MKEKKVKAIAIFGVKKICRHWNKINWLQIVAS